MNPQEFSWSEDQQVTVTNPTDQPYNFKVHSKEYQLGPHKSAKMPGYIAWVYVYGMATQLCQADGQFMRWNEEGFRQEYYERLVKNIDAIVQDVAEIPEPAVNTFDEEDDNAVAAADTPSATDAADALAAEEDEQEPEAPAQPDQPAPDAPEEPETPAETETDPEPAVAAPKTGEKHTVPQVKPMQAKIKANA